MESRKLALLTLLASLVACQSFPDVCREHAGGAGWDAVAPPDWANAKLAELDWPGDTKVYWYFDGRAAYRACHYRSGHGVPRCGGPVVAEYRREEGEWIGGLTLLHVCH